MSEPPSVESSAPDGREAPAAEPLPRAVIDLLVRPLDERLVAQRKAGKGTMVSYLEGYQAINQANRIFGYGRWGAEVVGPVAFRELSRADRRTGEITAVGLYWATVRVRVAGCEPRSDVGFAFTADDTPEAHDTAIKGAVTDAMKRALRHFGDQFGNQLYSPANPVHATAARELANLRAAVLTLGARLGLDETATREQAAKKIGRPFADLTAAELARLIRVMADALQRHQRAA